MNERKKSDWAELSCHSPYTSQQAYPEPNRTTDNAMTSYNKPAYNHSQSHKPESLQDQVRCMQIQTSYLHSSVVFWLKSIKSEK